MFSAEIVEIHFNYSPWYKANGNDTDKGSEVAFTLQISEVLYSLHFFLGFNKSESLIKSPVAGWYE